MSDDLFGFSTPAEASEWQALLAAERQAIAAETPIADATPTPAVTPTVALETAPQEAFTTDYRQLHRVIAERRMELGLSSLEVDELAGIAQGLTSKVECGDKKLGPLTLEYLLETLGLRLALVRVAPHRSTIGAQARVSPERLAARRQLWASKKRTADENAARQKVVAERNKHRSARRVLMQQAASAGPFAG